MIFFHLFHVPLIFLSTSDSEMIPHQLQVVSHEPVNRCRRQSNSESKPGHAGLELTHSDALKPQHVAKTWALNPDALGSVLTPSFLDVWPVAITFLRLNFYICKIGLMIVLASKSWGLNEVLHGKHSNTYPRTMFNTHLISIWGSDDWSQVRKYGLM